MRYRSTLAFLIAFLWMSSPLLACLPSSSMTPAEMECCKKMAGACDMGSGRHSCCNTTTNHSSLKAAVTETVTLSMQPVCIPVAMARTAAVSAPRTELSLPFKIPISPPGSSQILRI